MVQLLLLKTGSLDNAVSKSLAQPSWYMYMSNYTMLYKYGKHMHNFGGHFYLFIYLFILVFYILGLF